MKKAFRKNLNRLYSSYLVKVGSYNLIDGPLTHFVCSPNNHIDKSKDFLSDMYMEITIWELKK